MATSWYRDLGIGRWGSKMRVRVNALRQSRSSNYTRVKVRIYAYNGGSSKTYNLGRGAAVAVSGTVSHSDRATFSIGPRSWGTLADWEFNVDHGSDGEKSFSITGNLSDTGTSALGNGGSINVKGTLSPLYLDTAKPSWGSTDYRNPDRAVLTWSNNDRTRAPYDRVDIQRWDRGSGNWTHLGRMAGGAESYTDTAFPKNNEVRWRVQGIGPGGVSGWVQGGTLGTVPAAPTGVAAAKSGQNIDVSWTDNAAGTNRPRTFIVEDNPDGTGWVNVGTVGGSGESWTHTDADPAKTHQYRVTAQITSQIVLTSSASAASNVVQLQAPPAIPYREAPLDTTTQVIGEQITLVWHHRPVDTSAQTSAEVWWRVEGDDWTKTVVSGSAQHLDITPTTSTDRAYLEWQVRTKGAHPDWSPWSTTNGPLLSTRPTVVIQSPEHLSAIPTSRVKVDWTYQPNGTALELGASRWEITLIRWSTGNVLEVDSGTSGFTSEMSAILVNGEEYHLLLSVQNQDGLWSEASPVRFSVEFPVPLVQLIRPSWICEEGSVSLSFRGTGETPTTYNWTGVPQASASEMYAEDGTILATNDIQNPIGPGAVGVAHWITTDPASLEEVDGEPAALTLSDGSNVSLYADPEARPSPPVGTVVRFSVDVMVTVPTDGFRLTVSSYGGAEASNNSTGPVTLAPEDGWVRLSMESTIEAMPDGGYIRTIIWPLNGRFDAGEGFYWRRALRTFDGPGGLPFFDGDTPDTTTFDAVDVQRREPGGEWELIVSGLGPSTSIIDSTPALDDVEYRAVTRTSTGVSSIGPAETAHWDCPDLCTDIFVSGGTDLTMTCLGVGDSVSRRVEIEQDAVQFAGQSLPTPLFGISQGQSVSFSCLKTPTSEGSTEREWIELLHQFGLVLYRDTRGRKLYGLLSVDFSQSGRALTVSGTVDQTEFEEGVERVPDSEIGGA